MNPIKKICFSLLFLVSLTATYGQYTISPIEGYSPQIGAMVNMMEDLKLRITDRVKDLSLEETDFLFDEEANSIGSMIMHLAATEAYYQVQTLEGRNWTEEEATFWSVAGGLGNISREKLKGKPIQYYLDLWEEVRAKECFIVIFLK